MERTLNGASMQTARLLDQMKDMAGDLPAPLQREIAMVMHKMTFPMAEILAKVPGASLTERAKKLRVSRQTMYVWMNERFRPTKPQAKRIARITGVPIEHIIDNGWETNDDVRRKARKKIARMAARSKKTPPSGERVQSGRRRKSDAGSRDTAA